MTTSPLDLEAVRRRPVPIAVEELERLYRVLFLRLARRAAWRYRLSQDDATEVVQEVFLLALVKLKEQSNPRAWLYRALDNLAANGLRKEIRRKVLTARWGPSEFPLTSGSSDPKPSGEETDGLRRGDDETE
jgi:DNA-directed RNA polymerase specialized sigma24 family protein